MPAQDFWSSQRSNLDPEIDPLDAVDDEEGAEWEEPSYKDMILFCIDGGHSMYEINPTTQQTYIHQAIEGAFKVYDRKMVSSPSDYVGVMIFGTDRSDIPDARNARFHPHCVLYIPLSQVGIKNRMELKMGLAQADGDHTSWSKKFGLLQTKRQFPPHFAIQNASWIFRGAGKSGTKRVFWVTNNDNPDPSGKLTQLETALESLRDAKRLGIEFVPFLMNRERYRFDTSLFYGDLFEAYEDEYPDLTKDAQTERKLRTQLRPKWDWEVAAADFDNEVLTQETPKRTVYSVPLIFADNFEIGVKGYILNAPAKRARQGWFYNDEDGIPHEMVPVKQYSDLDTNRILGPHERVRAYTFPGDPSTGQTRVHLTTEELIKARTMGLQPGLRLLGTLPRSWLKPYHQIANPHFLYPTDQLYTGSRLAFASFLASLLKKDKLAIGLLMPKKNGVPYYVALVPQEEEISADGDQTRAPGLIVIRLPFSDEFRDPPATEALYADEKQTEAAKMVAKRYVPKRAYNPYEYSNPSLAMHFCFLQRAAYNETEEDIPTPVDSTIPKYAEIKDRCGDEIIRFNRLIDDDSRAQTFMSEGPAAIEVDEERVLQLWKEERLHTLKVDELKAICAKLHAPAGSRKKAELVIYVHNIIMDAYPEKVQAWDIQPRQI